jgi:large subunit ribosomal protein L35
MGFKLKRLSSAKKRFKLLGSGKLIKCKKSCYRHLLTKKKNSNKVASRRVKYIHHADASKIKKLIY